MDTKQVILELRTQKGMSQDELAEKVFVSRQAVSRWENGETVPNTETLKLLSKVFDVSINTLLGSPRKLICQCCGMPLEDDDIDMLVTLLSFPEKFWKIINQYYNAGKAWVPAKNIDKLKIVIEQNMRRRELIDKMCGM